MTRTEKILLRQEIFELSRWDANYQIMQSKFEELCKPHIGQDEFIILWVEYLNSKNHPGFRGFDRDGEFYNSDGVRWLHGLLNRLIDLLPDESTKQSDNSNDNNFDEIQIINGKK